MPKRITFDSCADDYDAQLAHGLSVTGEGKDYFARARIAMMTSCLASEGADVKAVLDFGCGTGGATPLFFEHLGCSRVMGVDESPRSIQLAASDHAELDAKFETLTSFEPSADVDAAYSNGVFHHISPGDRVAAAALVHSALKPGGFFALWENNPWNPGTRYVMRRVPFDRDAIMVSAAGARRILREAGFDVVRTDFLFIFPGFLSVLRFLEKPLSKLPLGGQYQVFARKPE